MGREIRRVPPDRAYDRDRDWTPDEATAYQVYETVSEGTPVSPVFATREDLKAWLISNQGMSDAGAEHFIGMGWVPSAVFRPQTGFVETYATAEPGVMGRKQ